MEKERESKYRLNPFEEEVLDVFVGSQEFHLLEKILKIAADNIMKSGFSDEEPNFMYYKGRLYECQQLPRELIRIVEKNRKRKEKKEKEDGKAT
jgi:hypothetical protein